MYSPVLQLTDITSKLINMGLLQQPQLAHARESIEGFINDKFFSITETLLKQRLQY